MRTPRISLPVLVAVAVACLVLGSLGTATASGLTSHAVKKIATQVVKKKAKKLSVAHAATADTATSATSAATAQHAGTVVAYSYTLPVQAATPVVTYLFPGLPPGTYLATYDVTASTATGSLFGCGFQVKTASTFGTAVDNFEQVTGSAVVTVTSSTFDLICNDGAHSYTLTNANPSTVTFVPVVATAATATGN